MYLWLVVSNVFLIPLGDVIVVLLTECGLVLRGGSLCFDTLLRRKAGRKKKSYLKCNTAALGCNHVRAMCGIPIILHKSYR